MRRLKAVARGYNLGLFRPFGKLIQRQARVEFALDGEEDPTRVHPVYGWVGGDDFIHIIAGSPDGHTVLTFSKGDLRAMLEGPPFARYQLTPDPTASIRTVAAMFQRGMLPASWETGYAEGA